MVAAPGPILCSGILVSKGHSPLMCVSPGSCLEDSQAVLVLSQGLILAEA